MTTIGGAVWAEPFQIVAFGDSLTAGYRPRSRRKLSRKARKGRATHTNGHDVVIANAGVSGDTTSGGLCAARLVRPRRHRQLVILELGANDMLRGVDSGDIVAQESRRHDGPAPGTRIDRAARRHALPPQISVTLTSEAIRRDLSGGWPQKHGRRRSTRSFSTGSPPIRKLLLDDGMHPTRRRRRPHGRGAACRSIEDNCRRMNGRR
jgi:acyl-CoA thioesterase-1